MSHEGVSIVRVVAELAERVAGSRRPAAPTAATPLGEGGFWLESIALLELVLACEERFGVTFDPDVDLTSGALATVGSLAELIRRRRGGD
jgi:acyl carrier protein